MVQTLSRTARAVAFILVVLASTPASASDLPVVIRLYDMATSDTTSRVVAMRTASAAIASAGLSVKWRDCSRGGAAHPCRTVRNAGDLVVRILPARSASTTGVAALADGESGVQLGFAPIDPAGRATVIATVYYDLVQRVAQRTGLAADVLLGRAIAHEIGHLLLRLPGHADTGLMRSLWTDEELMHDRPGDWTFSDADRRQVQEVARELAASGGAEALPYEDAGVDAAGR